MSLTVKKEGGDFELLPADVYTARCFKVIDLGTQTVEWQGDTKMQPKVMITWEILDDNTKMKDGRPFAISKTYTASLNEKSSLYQDLVKWRGQQFTQEELLGFDISKLLGAYCTLQIIHNVNGEKTYANIASIMKTKERPQGVNTEVMFDINNPDMDVFNDQPDWIKDKIRASQEWQERENTANGEDVSANNDDAAEAKDIQIEDLDSGEPVNLDDIPF
jgi:hypothetical protein